MSFRQPTALTIAGTDPTGGAGIQADIKTMLANGVYAMSVITAVIAQNTCGVFGLCNLSEELIRKQIDAIFTDIPPDAVKIGMIGKLSQARGIAEALRHYKARNIVLDPVLGASVGGRFMDEPTIREIKRELFSLSSLITPNIPETEALTGKTILSQKDMEKAAALLSEEYGCAVLIKGGHRRQDTDDLLYDKGLFIWFRGKRIDNPNTHGSGCTLSSAITSNLAKGKTLAESVEQAKAYLRHAIEKRLDLGQGNGPIDHGSSLSGQFIQ